MSTRAHIGQVLKIEILAAVLYTLSHICGSNHFPIYRAPTPLTKDVSGEYPFPILLSLPFLLSSSSPPFGCLLLLPLPVSVIVGTSGVLTGPSLSVICACFLFSPYLPSIPTSAILLCPPVDSHGALDW